MPPSHEVIIPHYNRWTSLRRALAALYAGGREVRICVVDNGSSDDSASLVARSFPDVRLVQLASNHGFGRACNIGIEGSRADFVVLLNNDTVADRSFMAAIEVTCLALPSEIVMVSACLLRPDHHIDSFGVEVDGAFNAFDAGHGLPHGAALAGDVKYVLGPTGGAAVYRRDAFLEVGGFDEQMFAYLEDVDLGLRLRLAGGKWAGAPEATAVHYHSATLGAGSSAKNYLMAQSKHYLLRKYRRHIATSAYARGVMSELIILGGKAAVDRNAGGLRGWLAAPAQPTPLDSSASVAPFLAPGGFLTGLRRRRTRHVTSRACTS